MNQPGTPPENRASGKQGANAPLWDLWDKFLAKACSASSRQPDLASWGEFELLGGLAALKNAGAEYRKSVLDVAIPAHMASIQYLAVLFAQPPSALNPYRIQLEGVVRYIYTATQSFLVAFGAEKELRTAHSQLSVRS